MFHLPKVSESFQAWQINSLTQFLRLYGLLSNYPFDWVLVIHLQFELRTLFQLLNVLLMYSHLDLCSVLKRLLGRQLTCH